MKLLIVRPMLFYIVEKLFKNACQLKNPRSATLFRIEVIIFWRDFFAQKQTFFSYSEAHCSKLVSGNPMLSYIVRKLWKRAFQQKNPHITTTFSIRAKKIRKKIFFQKKFFFAPNSNCKTGTPSQGPKDPKISDMGSQPKVEPCPRCP